METTPRISFSECPAGVMIGAGAGRVAFPAERLAQLRGTFHAERPTRNVAVSDRPPIGQ
jgi:hypothetical protein